MQIIPLTQEVPNICMFGGDGVGGGQEETILQREYA